MPVDNESLKRVLLSIKGAANGFKKDNLMSRLKPAADEPVDPLTMEPGGDTEPDPMDPNEPAEVAMGEAPELGAAPADDDDAAKKLEAIRRLIGSV